MWRLQQPSTLSTREAPTSSSVASLLLPPLLWQGIWSPWWLRVARVGILLATDLLALLAAVSVGYVLWAPPVLQQPPVLYADLLPLLWLIPLGYAGMGLYPGFGVGAVEDEQRLVAGVPVFGGVEMVDDVAERGVHAALVAVGEDGINSSLLSRFQQHFRSYGGEYAPD